MSATFPIPSHTRETTLVAAQGQKVFGPLDWILFGTDDVKVYVKAATGAVSYTELARDQFTASPAAPATAFPAHFTITLLIARSAGDMVRLQGARRSTRTTDVTRAGALQSQPLETELDRQVVTEQELRRDVDRLMGAMAIDAPNILADAIAARDAAAASAAALGNQARTYDTRTQATAANIPAGVQAVRILGINAPGDGGDGLYKKVGVQPTHNAKFQSADGAWWELVTAGNQAVEFNTRAQAAAAYIPAAVQAIRVYGAAAVGDGGEATYKKVGAQPSHSNKFQSLDGAWWERVETSAARLGRPRSGLLMSNHPTTPNTKLNFAPGFSADRDNTLDILLPSGLTKTTGAWAPGNDVGMLDQGVIAANAGYWTHLIFNPTTQASDILASISADNPLLPAGFTKSARLPCGFMTDASSFIYPGTWYADGSFELKQGPTVAANRSLQFASLLFLRVPIGVKLRAKCLVTVTNDVDAGNPAFYFILRDPDLGPPTSPAQASFYKPPGAFTGGTVEARTSTVGEVYTWGVSGGVSDSDNRASIVLQSYTDAGDEFA